MNDPTCVYKALPAPAERVLHRLCAATAWTVLHPLRVPPIVTPRALGLRYRRVAIESGGVRLSAWHVPCEGARAGIVLCHGHNNSRLQFVHLVRPLHRAGFHVLLFDFRSMGVSGGRVCTYGHQEQHDVLAAVEWLRREAGVERVGLMGMSMGAASALLAAARDPRVEAVVSDCAFARLADMVEQKFFYLPRRLRTPVGRSVRHWAEHWSGTRVDEVDPEAAVRGWRPRPLLVIHGERDLLVPVEHGRRIARAGGEQAELWVVPHGHHAKSSLMAPRQYPRRVVAFFQRHLGPDSE